MRRKHLAQGHGSAEFRRDSRCVFFGNRIGYSAIPQVQSKGRKQTFRTVAAGEADPAKGLLSFRAPLAKAVMGAKVGDVIEADEPLGEIEIVEMG